MRDVSFEMPVLLLVEFLVHLRIAIGTRLVPTGIGEGVATNNYEGRNKKGGAFNTFFTLERD
jgi:hypothetical protein